MYEDTDDTDNSQEEYLVRAVYNTVKFHWVVKQNLPEEMEYEVSLFFYKEDLDLPTKREDA